MLAQEAYCIVSSVGIFDCRADIVGWHFRVFKLYYVDGHISF